jgi:hypothetical protein
MLPSFQKESGLIFRRCLEQYRIAARPKHIVIFQISMYSSGISSIPFYSYYSHEKLPKLPSIYILFVQILINATPPPPNNAFREMHKGPPCLLTLILCRSSAAAIVCSAICTIPHPRTGPDIAFMQMPGSALSEILPLQPCYQHTSDYLQILSRPTEYVGHAIYM